VSEPVTLTQQLSTEAIPAMAGPRLVYLLLEVSADREAAGSARRLPMNLGLVVDTSRSMRVPLVNEEQFEWFARQGYVQEVMVDGLPVWRVEHMPPEIAADLPTSLSFVRRALEAVGERLQPGDRSTLVAFATEAQTVLPSATGRGRLSPQALDTLARLDLGEETYMARGLGLGLEEVQRWRSPEQVSRILLLTDGYTLDEEECRALAGRAREAGVALSTLGLGIEFNEELLIALAEGSGGHAYLAHDPREVPDAFVEELERVASVTYRNLELKLRLTPGVELRRAYRVQPVLSNLGDVPSEGGSANLFLGDLEWDAPPAVLLELILPPRAVGVYRLCQVALAYDDPNAVAGYERPKVRQDIVIQYSYDPAALARPDGRVLHVVERVTAFRLQTQALEQAASGDLEGATRKLRAAATRLLDMGEANQAAAALHEAESLETQGQMSPASRKEMRYATRRLTQPLENSE
jgi:Ca-activated chloride channel family protein